MCILAPRRVMTYYFATTQHINVFVLILAQDGMNNAKQTRLLAEKPPFNKVLANCHNVWGNSRLRFIQKSSEVIAGWSEY